MKTCKECGMPVRGSSKLIPGCRYCRVKTPEPLKYVPDVGWQRGWVSQCIFNAFQPTQDWEEGFTHAMNVMATWLDFRNQIGQPPNAIDMWKSDLLGRMMRKEQIRKRPCPLHKGMMWCGWGLSEQFLCGCGGTGWLPNEGAPEFDRTLKEIQDRKAKMGVITDTDACCACCGSNWFGASDREDKWTDWVQVGALWICRGCAPLKPSLKQLAAIKDAMGTYLVSPTNPEVLEEEV